jgi:hypothetical protein
LSWLDQVEAAVHLLRMAPAGSVAMYYVGSLPFVLGLLYFWGDMSQSAFAYLHAAEAALLVAGLFVWMKAWQAVFVQRLDAEVRGTPPQAPDWRKTARTVMAQTLIQPFGLFLLPVTMLTVLPFAWTYAFFQNALVFGDGNDETEQAKLGVPAHVVHAIRQAAAEAGRWPLQNHLVIWLTSPFLVVAAAGLFLVLLPVVGEVAPQWTGVLLYLYTGLFVLALVPLSPLGIAIAVNLASLITAMPLLLQMLLGIDTMFARSPSTLANSTFFAVVCGLTYLCMDPVVKAVYVLRCFYGQALHTGEDLQVALRNTQNATR